MMTAYGIAAGTAAEREKKLLMALTEIRRMAMEHPCFYLDAFEERDIKGLCHEGGDTCAWTMIAIIADDVLSEE